MIGSGTCFPSSTSSTSTSSTSTTITVRNNNMFEEDRVYRSKKMCSTGIIDDGFYHGGSEDYYPIGTKGIILEIIDYENIKVKWDNGVVYTMHTEELELEQKEPNGGINMDKPETQLEKNACEEAKVKVVAEETRKKAELYESGVRDFVTYERNALSYRKRADELREKLGITDKQKKDLV